MRRVDAQADAAEVVEGQPIGDGTDERLVGDAVRNASAAIEMHRSVTVPVGSQLPQPAAVGVHINAPADAVT